MKTKKETQRKLLKEASFSTIGSCFESISVLPDVGKLVYPRDIESMLVDIKVRRLHFRACAVSEKHPVHDLSD